MTRRRGGGVHRPRSDRRHRSTSRSTTRRRAVTSARTTARVRSSTPRPSTARRLATSAASCEGRKSMDALKLLNKERSKRKRIELIDYEAKLAFELHRPKRRCPSSRGDDVVDQALYWEPSVTRRSAAVPARERGRVGQAARCSRRHPARVEPRRARSGAYLEMIGVDSRNVVFSGRGPAKRCRPFRRLGRSLLPRARSPRAHIHNLLFKHHEEAAQLHLLPVDHARPDVHREPDGYSRLLPSRLGHAEGDPRRSRRDRLLRRAQDRYLGGGDAERTR